MTTYVHSYLAEFLKWEMFQIAVVGKIKTNILYSVTFRNRAVNEITWKNIVQPDMPKMTIWRMRNAYWKTKATHTRIFSTASMVARTRLNVALYVHCLSCYHQRSAQFCCFSLHFLVLEEVYRWKSKTILKMTRQWTQREDFCCCRLLWGGMCEPWLVG